MSQLTKEQIEAAVKAFDAQDGGFTGSNRAGLIAAAPYLQLPWEPPTDMECSFFGTRKCTYGTKAAIEDFISRRNAALLPNVDDRLEVVRSILYLADRNESGIEVAKRILAALDKVRP